MRNRRFRSLLLAVPLLFAAACGGDEKAATGGDTPAKESAPEPATISIGMLAPSLSNSGIYIADAKGYFEAEGITLEQEIFRAGDAQVASLARGDLQIATGGHSAGLYNAISSGVGAKIVADKGQNREGFEWMRIVTSKANHDAGLTSLADLKGKKIAVPGTGATADSALGRILEDEGLGWDDVELSVMPFPEMQTALEGGSVDAIFPIEPFLTRALSGGGVLLGSALPVYPVQQLGDIFFSERFIEENRDAGERWMVAYLKGVRDYNDAFVNDRGREEIEKILVEAGVAEDPALFDKLNLVYLDPNGEVSMDSLSADIEYYQSRDYLDHEVSVKSLVDASFVEHAVEELGPYEN